MSKKIETCEVKYDKDGNMLDAVFPNPHEIAKSAINKSKESKKMNGRIETYIHSDSINQNKGGVMVKVSCESDFAAKTPEFIEFCQEVARLCYAVLAVKEDKATIIPSFICMLGLNFVAKRPEDVIEEISEMFEGFANRKADLEKSLKEKIKVEEIVLLKL